MRQRLVWFVIVLLAPIAPALAAPITFQFEGTVILDRDGFGAGLGSTVTGSFTFESTTPEDFFPGSGSYTGAVTEVSADFGGNLFVLTSPATSFISVNNDIPGLGDLYAMAAIGDGTYNGVAHVIGVTLQLQDPDGLILDGTSLPLTPPGLPSAPEAFPPLSNMLFQLNLDSGFNPTAGIEIKSLTLAGATAIPEPVSALLLGVGGVIVGAAVRRRVEQ